MFPIQEKMAAMLSKGTGTLGCHFKSTFENTHRMKHH